MPVAVATPVLATGLVPLFRAETAPSSTRAAADAWAKAYADYLVAGGIPGATAKQPSLANSLERAFNPQLGGGGPLLFMTALQLFWLGMPVPAQVGVCTAFIPTTTNLNSPQPPDATPEQSANGLALLISRLTLGAVKLTVPPGVIAPLL